MGEIYLFYSSLTLFVMGCLALALSVFFRLRFRVVNSFPNLSANVFNKSFIVYDPYPERRKVIHSLLFILPMIAFLVCTLFALFVLKVLEAGFLLSLLIVIVGLNLMAVESAPEVHQISKIFVKAVEGGTSFGVGDMKVFQVVKNVLPRIIKYYLGLSILFVALAVALPYIWSSLLWVLTQSIGPVFEVSVSAGVVSYQVMVLLFAVVLGVLQIFVSKIKKKLLNI